MSTTLVKGKDDIIKPEKNNQINLSAVAFKKTWTFWEGYYPKPEVNYEDLNKEIFEWKNAIAFFQFWNNYPGKNICNIFFDGTYLKYFFEEKFRINSMNIFVKGIKPMWEDEANLGGKYLQLEYTVPHNDILNFSNSASKYWKYLALMTMGSILPGSEYINGIRFVDKIDFVKGNKIRFRMEVWVNKNMPEESRNKLSEELKNNFGCGQVLTKDIKLDNIKQ